MKSFNVGDKVIVGTLRNSKDGEVVAVLYNDEHPIVVKHESFRNDGEDVYQAFNYEGLSKRNSSQVTIRHAPEYRYANVYNDASSFASMLWKDKDCSDAAMDKHNCVGQMKGELTDNGRVVNITYIPRDVD